MRSYLPMLCLALFALAAPLAPAGCDLPEPDRPVVQVADPGRFGAPDLAAEEVVRVDNGLPGPGCGAPAGNHCCWLSGTVGYCHAPLAPVVVVGVCFCQ